MGREDVNEVTRRKRGAGSTSSEVVLQRRRVRRQRRKPSHGESEQTKTHGENQLFSDARQRWAGAGRRPALWVDTRGGITSDRDERLAIPSLVSTHAARRAARPFSRPDGTSSQFSPCVSVIFGSPCEIFSETSAVSLSRSGLSCRDVRRRDAASEVLRRSEAAELTKVVIEVCLIPIADGVGHIRPGRIVHRRDAMQHRRKSPQSAECFRRQPDLAAELVDEAPSRHPDAINNGADGYETAGSVEQVKRRAG